MRIGFLDNACLVPSEPFSPYPTSIGVRFDNLLLVIERDPANCDGPVPAWSIVAGRHFVAFCPAHVDPEPGDQILRSSFLVPFAALQVHDSEFGRGKPRIDLSPVANGYVLVDLDGRGSAAFPPVAGHSFAPIDKTLPTREELEDVRWASINAAELLRIAKALNGRASDDLSPDAGQVVIGVRRNRPDHTPSQGAVLLKSVDNDRPTWAGLLCQVRIGYSNDQQISESYWHSCNVVRPLVELARTEGLICNPFPIGEPAAAPVSSPQPADADVTPAADSSVPNAC